MPSSQLLNNTLRLEATAKDKMTEVRLKAGSDGGRLRECPSLGNRETDSNRIQRLSTAGTSVATRWNMMKPTRADVTSGLEGKTVMYGESQKEAGIAERT